MLDSFVPMASDENLTTSFVNRIPIGKPVVMSARGLFFPADSAFVERAAMFSHAGGHFSGIINSLASSQPVVAPSCADISRDVIGSQLQKITLTVSEAKDASLPLPLDHESTSGSPIKNQRNKASAHLTGGSQETRTGSAGAPGESCPSDLGAKKRKPIDPDKERGERARRWPRSSSRNAAEGIEAKQKQEPKHVDDGSEMPKEDYVHVRARRGQATNSHSIAERLRRERISERMKYLQNLVPGCSKVTGKAVMLDEIINYVQSLQQQVEFLSMKLAAVNAQHNYGMEELVAKEMHSCDDTLSAAGLPQEMMMMMIHPQLHPSSQQYVVPGGICSMMQGSWEEELSAAMKLTSGTCPPINAQDNGGKPCDDFTM
ncbi:unnamed protein product [Musa acuminata subsp. malaccensis]|uniref:(wild Malaysian banana) hypothetical protein n=1 Tax=Musa acuminata subsp. malaccensis TaxID=214687 RepID=A0A804HNN6_MUSAM|nr:PREDICTED: transcription factor bHLH49-like [Musa acuminata subsp. malaccensis]CAG1858126.1 unnamed protein product [Musa acuminata subsp. malaccensis]